MNDEPSASIAHATDQSRYATTIEPGRIAHARERFSVWLDASSLGHCSTAPTTRIAFSNRGRSSARAIREDVEGSHCNIPSVEAEANYWS